MDSYILDAVARTDKGLVRKSNEDAYSLLPEYGLVVIADGMGGHKAGEVASRIAVQKISDVLISGLDQMSDDLAATQDLLQQAVEQANQVIFDKAEQLLEYQGMGTTVVAGLFIKGRLFYAHVGDSRLYLLRNGRLIPLTSDHTLLQSLLNKGVFKTRREARLAGIPSSKLTRAVGLFEQVDVDSADIELKAGDVYLFCSDGLTDMVTDAMIGAVIQESLLNLPYAADLLLELALMQGGVDNISLVLARPDQASVGKTHVNKIA